MFEGYIRIVIWPYDTIDVARHRDKETRVGELLDGSFNHLAHLNVSDLQELLIEDCRLHGELKETIEGEIPSHSSSMNRARLPRARGGD